MASSVLTFVAEPPVFLSFSGRSRESPDIPYPWQIAGYLDILPRDILGSGGPSGIFSLPYHPLAFMNCGLQGYCILLFVFFDAKKVQDFVTKFGYRRCEQGGYPPSCR